MSAPLPSWQNQVLLAPLTKGGNLPFRRLCVDFGAQMTCSEMAYAREIVRRRPRELALLRHHASEPCFGVQLAARREEECLRAANRAVEEGAQFIDLNVCCPIHDTTRRGLGAQQLVRPKRLGALLASMVSALPVPVTVKIRTGWSAKKINAHRIAEEAEAAGVSAISVHGRSREQRYSRTADWDLMSELSAARTVPIVGNGDLLTWYEVEDRWTSSGVASVMLARAALIKPWIFQEIAEKRELCLSAEQRVEVYLRLAGYLRDNFGDSERGRGRAMFFLAWHFRFFH